MSHLTGECPVCKKAFQEGDDVVICPSCGAPYHRTCYRQAGECVFADKHGSGFEYSPPGSSAAKTANTKAGNTGPAGTQADGENAGGVLCTQCGTINDRAGIFCENCGAALHAPSGTHGPAGGAFRGGAFGLGGYSPFGGGAQAEPAFAGEVDGIAKEDWAAFIGPSAPAYLMRMDTMKRTNRKVSFMFSAFFVPPLYFAYRKMWGWAALALAASLLFLLPQNLWMLFDAGVLAPPSAGFATFLDYASTAATFLSLGTRAVFGLFALPLFEKTAVKRMKEVRQNSDGTDCRQELAKRGGVSVAAVVAVLVLVLAFHMAFILADYNTMMAYMMETVNQGLGTYGLL